MGLLATMVAVSCTMDRIGPEVAGDGFRLIQPSSVSVSRVEVHPRNLFLYIGQTGQLHATIYPSNATDQRLRWTSTLGCVYVDQNGVVTAMAKGNASVTVHTIDGDYQSTARIFVTINPVVGVEFGHGGEVILTRGERFDLQARAVGEDRTVQPSYPGLEWSSSAPEIVSVESGRGRITALASGEAFITATSAIDNSKYATCRVVVLNAGPAAEGGVGFRNLDI